MGIVVWLLPLAMIIIGSRYKDECPVDSKIPIWLIVTGAFVQFETLLRVASEK